MHLRSLASRVLRIAKNEPAVQRVIARSKQPGTGPKDWFSGLDDETWLWMNTTAQRRLTNLLPGVPEASVQEMFTGQSGDATLREGFNAYKIIKDRYETHVGPIESCRVLDFGCGWGRILRFFLKDVEPGKLFGVDHSEEMIRTCQDTNMWCSFTLVEPDPPMSFAAESFDLIYLYSVFSHLPEQMHWELLKEFQRLLRPGGLLIATTFPREFFGLCKAVRDDQQVKPKWLRDTTKAFVDVDTALSVYDNGEFCYSPRGAEGRWSFWGEACIPKAYVERRWPELFDVCEYIDDRDICPQNVIVARKGTRTN